MVKCHKLLGHDIPGKMEYDLDLFIPIIAVACQHNCSSFSLVDPTILQCSFLLYSRTKDDLRENVYDNFTLSYVPPAHVATFSQMTIN